MNNLAKYRAKHGLTQEELGDIIGISKAGVCFYETHTISAKTAKKFSAILNENVFEILGPDALVLLPKTEEEKEILIKMIKGL